MEEFEASIKNWGESTPVYPSWKIDNRSIIVQVKEYVSFEDETTEQLLEKYREACNRPEGKLASQILSITFALCKHCL